ncbi:hypothetical protein [Limnohabitans sp.]|uniref:hypothetical protein n=1 Tax=Limnohabitans sp. TaxID=1907725 RepID=UPI0037BE590A
MSPVFAFNKWPRALGAVSKLSVAVSAATLLLACGGQGDGSISANSGAEVVLKAGEAAVIVGSLESVKYRLTNMTWSVMPLVATNPDLTLLNEDCEVAIKNDSLTPTLATSTSPAGSGGSDWQCKLVVGLKDNVSTDALYDLTLSGMNELNRQVTYKRTLRVQPNPTLFGFEPSLAVPNNFVIQPVSSVCKPGFSVALNAVSTDATAKSVFYRWRIVQGPTVFLAGANTSQLGFITPLVSESTVMVVQLETSQTAFTDDTPVANSATSVIHVDPTYLSPSCFSN